VIGTNSSSIQLDTGTFLLVLNIFSPPAPAAATLGSNIFLALRTCERDLIDDPFKAVEDEHDNESCNKLKVESNLAVLREGQERDRPCGASAKQNCNQISSKNLPLVSRHCLMKRR
jgi:hypothetical protein